MIFLVLVSKTPCFYSFLWSSSRATRSFDIDLLCRQSCEIEQNLVNSYSLFTGNVLYLCAYMKVIGNTKRLYEDAWRWLWNYSVTEYSFTPRSFQTCKGPIIDDIASGGIIFVSKWSLVLTCSDNFSRSGQGCKIFKTQNCFNSNWFAGIIYCGVQLFLYHISFKHRFICILSLHLWVCFK